MRLMLYGVMVLRQLRGSRSGLWLMVVCLLLASTAMSIVGLLGSSVRGAIERDGRSILGGDIELALVQRQARDDELRYIDNNSAAYSAVTTMSSMVRVPSDIIDDNSRSDIPQEALVSLKAVDNAYPLVGVVITDQGEWSAMRIAEALAEDGQGYFGAMVQPTLLERLDLSLGDVLELGSVRVRLVALIEREPDPWFGTMVFGPKMIISREAVTQSGLLQPGALLRNYYRVLLPENSTLEQWRNDFGTRFEGVGWRIRDYTRPMRSAERGLDRTLMFLSLSTLITVIAAGIGISNGVRRFLQTHLNAIATLRVVGATRNDIIVIYGLLIFFVALSVITLGLLIALAGLFILLPLLENILPIALTPTLHAEPILYSYINGLLLSAVFAMLIVFSAAETNPGLLFRQARNTMMLVWPQDRWKILLFMIIVALFLLVNVGLAEHPDLAAIFLAGSGLLLLALWGLSRLVAVISRLWRADSFLLRYALSNLTRPGAVTGQIVVSLGLGLTVLVLINSLSLNMTARLKDVIENEAPSFYFIDIQHHQLPQFEQIMQPFEASYNTTPMLRGRITHLAGTPVAELPKNDDFDWITRGDRAFTWASRWEGKNARSAPIVQGEWWPEDYTGDLLVSFDAEAAEAFGLQLGDKMGLNILGREFEATIANFREIEWGGLGMNFVVVLSPGLLDQAPHTNIAEVAVAEVNESRLQSTVVNTLPNVSAIRLKDILTQLTALLSRMVLTIQSIGGVSIVVGIAVLMSALSAVQAQKSYENHILRVLGADRKRLFGLVSIELLLLGTLAAVVAAISGNLLSWAIIQIGLNTNYILSISNTVWVVLLGQCITLIFGLSIAWRDLSKIDVKHLRDD